MSPLTKLGRKMRNIFIEEYGKKKGNRVFYGFVGKNSKLKLERRKT